MIVSKALYSKIFKEYEINDDQLCKLHKVLFEMLCDIKTICEKHKIKYMLSGGSVLGAVRHKGFIPWDDDIDVMLTRSNYEKLSQIIRKEYSEKFLIVEPLDKNYYFKMPKLLLKNSIYTELAAAGTPEHHMIFIDLFIIEYVPDNILVRKIKGYLYDFAYKASSVCIDYLFPSPPIINKGKQNRMICKYYNRRRQLGFIFSKLGGIEFYLKVDEAIAKSTAKSKWMGIPSGISYNREVFKTIMFEELTETEFEGELFPIPKYYHLYLKNLYGDNYMELPPKSQRQMHLATELVFPD